jgi:hypothetical protein
MDDFVSSLIFRPKLTGYPVLIEDSPLGEQEDQARRLREDCDGGVRFKVPGCQVPGCRMRADSPIGSFPLN